MKKKLSKKRKIEKEKTSQNKKYDSLKAVGVILLLFIPIFVIIYFNGKNRKKKLENDSFETLAVVEKLVYSSKKGTNTSEDIVYFYFVQDSIVYHKLTDLPVGAIKNLSIKEDYCYRLQVVKSDFGIFDVDFDNRIDTIIDKFQFSQHEYNTSIHKEIIE